MECRYIKYNLKNESNCALPNLLVDKNVLFEHKMYYNFSELIDRT